MDLRWSRFEWKIKPRKIWVRRFILKSIVNKTLPIFILFNVRNHILKPFLLTKCCQLILLQIRPFKFRRTLPLLLWGHLTPFLCWNRPDPFRFFHTWLSVRILFFQTWLVSVPIIPQAHLTLINIWIHVLKLVILRS